MNEDSLIFERIRADDKNAFEVLFKKYYASFCVVAYRYIEDKDVAKDIAQEVFIKLWDKRQHYKDLPSVKTFLYVLVKNASLNYIRAAKAKERHHSEIGKEGEAFFHEATIPEETFRQLESQIENLPSQSANIMRLTFQGYSNPEIAETLGISINTVKTLKYNAMRSLRENMGDVAFSTIAILFAS
jgi:RNA polymerase sigma-70 factor (family 1)